MRRPNLIHVYAAPRNETIQSLVATATNALRLIAEKSPNEILLR